MLLQEVCGDGQKYYTYLHYKNRVFKKILSIQLLFFDTHITQHYSMRRKYSTYCILFLWHTLESDQKCWLTNEERNMAAVLSDDVILSLSVLFISLSVTQSLIVNVNVVFLSVFLSLIDEIKMPT